MGGKLLGNEELQRTLVEDNTDHNLQGDVAAEEERDNLHWGQKGIPKNLSSQDFGEVRVNFLALILTKTLYFMCRRPELFRGKASDNSLLLKDFFSLQLQERHHSGTSFASTSS